MRGVYFNGKQRYIPGGYSKRDTSAATPITAGSLRVLGFVGTAQGGKPGTVLSYSNPVAAAAELRGGDLLTAMNIAWSPSPEVPGADVILVVRVNPATQSTLTLQDSTPADAIKLTSLDYGIWTTGIKAKVEAGTTASTVKVTITYGTAIEVYDNLVDNDAVVAALNAGSKYVSATKIGSTIIANTAETALTGGTEGAATATDWDNALAALGQKQVHGLLPVTDDATVHASFLAHCTSMSSNKKERRGFFGHALSEAKADILTRAKNLSSHRAVQVTPGIKREGTLLSAVFTAAAVAGMWAGAERTEPLTLDQILCEGLETIYDDADFADFENGGVLAIADNDGVGYQIVHAITTHLADDNTVRVELLKDSLADDIDVNMRTTLAQKYAGKGSLKNATTSIYNSAITLLNKMRDNDNWIVDDTDASGAVIAPAYKNVSVTKNGTAFEVSYEAAIIDPTNYVLVTSRFTS